MGEFLMGSFNAAIIIPAYNHSETLTGVVKKAVKTGLPVIVVDDGTTDTDLGHIADLDGVSLFRHSSNQGKGAAIMTGFREAVKTADWAVTIDADGQHDPTDLPDMIRAIPDGSRPIVVGLRQGMGRQVAPWTSRFGRKFSNFWVWVSGGQWIQDSQSGFRIYPLPEVLNLGVRARRFQFEVEVLVKAGWRNLPVLEVPVRVAYRPAGRRISHFRPFVDFMRNSSVFTRLIFQRIFRLVFRRAD